MEDTDTSAGEGRGRTTDFRASAGTSQSLLAYAVAGVALAAVIASGMMFLSHYPASTPTQLAHSGEPELDRAPLRLVSPRAMTAEEMRAGGSLAEPSPQAAVTGEPDKAVGQGVTPAPTDLMTGAPMAAKATVSEAVPEPADPVRGDLQPARLPTAVGTITPASSGSRLVSTTLVAETEAIEAAPVSGLEVARIEEPTLAQEPSPGGRGGDDAQPEAVDIMASTEAQRPDAAIVEPHSEPSEALKPEGAYRYPDSRRLYPPPMPPYPPPAPYMRHNLGPGAGYYRMNTVASGD